MKILAIESSCDETAVAVVEDGRKVLSSTIHTQIEEHKLYGGVVPEIASRRHTESIVQVTKQALLDAKCTIEDIDAIGVTAAPGLIGALLVGINYAKGLSLASGKPLIPVHHIRGHVAANYIEYPELQPPFLCLIASGGHSHIVEVKSYTDFNVVGRTRDDAAGEAFDKVARCLGFPYPGGIYIDRAAQQGESGDYKLPYPKTANPYDFSFSGLKTAVINLVHNRTQKGEAIVANNLARDFQDKVSEILTTKLILAAEEYKYKKIVLSGGVSANTGLRARVEQECQKRGFELYMPPLDLCGDNAAMIGSQAYYEYLSGSTAGMELNGIATMSIEKSFNSVIK